MMLLICNGYNNIHLKILPPRNMDSHLSRCKSKAHIPRWRFYFMEEKWVPIPGYEKLYLVSNIGRVKSIFYKRLGKEIILKQAFDRRGYPQVILVKEGKLVSRKIHRLVLMSFIPNPENKPCINHKNGIKNDNRLENLEWCTQKENITHSFNNLGNVSNKKGKIGAHKNILQINPSTNEKINEWKNMTEAARNTGVNTSSIWRSCNGETKIAGGYKWEYKK